MKGIPEMKTKCKHSLEKVKKSGGSNGVHQERRTKTTGLWDMESMEKVLRKKSDSYPYVKNK